MAAAVPTKGVMLAASVGTAAVRKITGNDGSAGNKTGATAWHRSSLAQLPHSRAAPLQPQNTASRAYQGQARQKERAVQPTQEGLQHEFSQYDNELWQKRRIG